MKTCNYRVIFGREGIDKYFIKFADGRTEPWPTKQEIQEWTKDITEKKILKIRDWKKTKFVRG